VTGLPHGAAELAQPWVPNLFVIGAAKSATSSLKRWLGDHPGVYTSKIDETRFLMDPADPLALGNGYTHTGLAGYRRFFPPEARPDSCRHVLDVTPMYYYQDTARQVIPAVPGSRAIFVARRPGSRIKSLYDFAKNNIGVLPAGISFSDFVAEVEKGPDSDLIGGYPMMCHSIEHSKYATYLKGWMEAMGQDRVSVLIFEEMVADPAAALRRLAVDLDLDPGFYDSYAFPRENESFVVSNRLLHRLARGLRRRLPEDLRSRIKASYMRLNTSRNRPPVTESDKAVMAMIDHKLEPWEKKLAQMIGRSAIWTTPPF
jgi:hypothetical protein